MRHALLIVFAALIALSPARATTDSEQDELRASYEAMQVKNRRLQAIGWTLVRANADLCKDAQLSIGITLVDMAGFAEPEKMQRALGLKGNFALASVSTMEMFKGPQVGQEITAIEGAQINQWPAEERLDWKRLKRAHDAIDAALAARGSVRLTFGDGSEADLPGAKVCPTRFELRSGGKKALADGSRVQFGSQFPGFAYAESEFAAVIAHELAHNLLKHRKWLDANGRKRRNVRATEREADRLMPWLLANAGYDPMAAVRFMERWGPKHSKGIFRARTHEGWDERAEHIEAEAKLVLARRYGGDTVESAMDWSTDFRREIEPLNEPGTGPETASD